MAPVEDALTLPPVVYTSEEFLDFERRVAVRPRVAVRGAASRIPNPGDFFTVRPNGEGVIVARAKDGAVHAFSSVCRHRGMEVADGEGTCTTFTCPYHHWIYGLDGRLLGAPAMERTHDFEKKDWGLPEPGGRGVAGVRVRQPGPVGAAARRPRSPGTSRSSTTTTSTTACARARSPSPTFPGTGRSCSRTSTTATTPTGCTRSSRTSARATWPRSRSRGTTRPTSCSAPTATPTSTAASTRRPRPSYRSSPT